jgi:hypothetical protein
MLGAFVTTPRFHRQQKALRPLFETVCWEEWSAILEGRYLAAHYTYTCPPVLKEEEILIIDLCLGHLQLAPIPEDWTRDRHRRRANYIYAGVAFWGE